MPTPSIELPEDLRPRDGRFGSGPSKVRDEAVAALAEVAPRLLGTSHRKTPVRDQVRRVRDGLRTFFGLPDDYEVALGNGGATLFWDAACASLIANRSAHAVFGEFSTKFAAAAAATPHLEDPVVVESPPGTHPRLEAVAGVDSYALTHCETSTGVAMPVARVPGADEGALVLVDATSAAGGLAFDPREVDAYYFSPQKGFGSEGGLWVALLSPQAVRRLDEVADRGRHVPAMLDLRLALENSRKDQTYNTPSAATIFLMAEQIEWLNAQGGLAAAVKDCAAKAATVYAWAEASDYATPFVTDPGQRADVVCTVDLADGVAADDVTAVLRANGVLDIDAYRKLGRNQLRIAVFPAVVHSDVERLTASIDHVVERLAG